jgi:hypothetical protein
MIAILHRAQMPLPCFTKLEAMAIAWRQRRAHLLSSKNVLKPRTKMIAAASQQRIGMSQIMRPPAMRTLARCAFREMVGFDSLSVTAYRCTALPDRGGGYSFDKPGQP